MNAIIYAEWGRRYLDETLGLVGSPARLRLAVFAELRLGQVVGAVDTYGLETEGTELQDSGTGNVTLAAGEHSLDIGHHGLQVLTLVEEHAVPVGHLVFPVLLPLREG